MVLQRAPSKKVLEVSCGHGGGASYLMRTLCWRAQETGHSGTERQLGLFVRIEGTVQRDVLERAIRQVVREAESGTASFFEVDGQVFQRATDYPDVELAFYDLSCSPDPVQEAREIASSIQRTPMPLGGPLFKFVLFRTRLDELYLFG
jgi:hypothetical protein